MDCDYTIPARRLRQEAGCDTWQSTANNSSAQSAAAGLAHGVDKGVEGREWKERKGVVEGSGTRAVVAN